MQSSERRRKHGRKSYGEQKKKRESTEYCGDNYCAAFCHYGTGSDLVDFQNLSDEYSYHQSVSAGDYSP